MSARMPGKYFFSNACSYWMYLSSAGKSATRLSSAIAASGLIGIVAAAIWKGVEEKIRCCAEVKRGE